MATWTLFHVIERCMQKFKPKQDQNQKLVSRKVTLYVQNMSTEVFLWQDLLRVWKSLI